MKRFKPINLSDNKGFWPEKAAVVDGIREVLTLGDCGRPLPVHDYGRYVTSKWRDDENQLVPWQSADWYVVDAMNETRVQVDASRMIGNMAKEPSRKEDALGDHYDLFLMDEDMYDPVAPGSESVGMSYAVGCCRPFVASVISTHRLDQIPCMPYSFLKTEVMRQVCFLFGVPGGDRGDEHVCDDGAVRCTNTCILRDARTAPTDWDALTVDRIRHGALCPACREQLTTFFAEAERELD